MGSQYFSVKAASSTGDRFPSLRPQLAIEVDAIADTAGLSGQKLILPGFRPVWKALEPLGVTESAGQFILCQPSNARFKVLYARLMGTRGEQDYEQGESPAVQK